jgi:hypothetical protein
MVLPPPQDSHNLDWRNKNGQFVYGVRQHSSKCQTAQVSVRL